MNMRNRVATELLEAQYQHDILAVELRMTDSPETAARLREARRRLEVAERRAQMVLNSGNTGSR